MASVHCNTSRWLLAADSLQHRHGEKMNKRIAKNSNSTKGKRKVS